MEEYRDKEERDAFRLYSSELLRVVANGMISLNNGQPISQSWDDVLHYKPETRTPEEIKDRVLKTLENC